MPEHVSVIIPCRNGAAYLAQAIASARLEGAHEIIVVDDGSEDASADIAESADAVLLHRQPPMGAAAARNAGIAMATGGYIGFLDADDLWTQGSLACRLSALKHDPGAAAAYGHVRHFYSPELDAASRAAIVCPSGAQPVRLPGSILFRREVFTRIGGFDETLKIGEMFDFIAKFGEAGFAAVCLADVVLARRLHARNMTRAGNAARSGYLHSLKAVLDRRRMLVASGKPT